MLRHLRVTNFALLSDVGIELSAGFNVFTGETGAGKSLIVEAVNLLRGGRASADIPRAGASEAVVEALFKVPSDLATHVEEQLLAAGLPASDDDLLVRRVIHKGGRSRTYVNGALTTAGRLAQLGAVLVELAGQHQHQGLIDPKRHLSILDGFCHGLADNAGASDHKALLHDMVTAFEALQAATVALTTLRNDATTRQDQRDYLRFQLSELDDAMLVDGEDLKLTQERARLGSLDQLTSGARHVQALVYDDDDSAVDRLGHAASDLARLAQLDTALEEPRGQIEEAQALAEDAARTLRSYTDELDGDPRLLEQVQDRLALLRKLARKHGGTIADAIARREQLRTELDGIDNYEERITTLETTYTTALTHATAAANALTVARKHAAALLSKRVGEALADLGMPTAVLDLCTEPRDLSPLGADKVELRLAANEGEDAKPLTKVASGGELSRIMLAIKLVLRRADAVATYVFDEVDAGIGGATAEVVGRQIRSVGNQRQVLCVTHLAQIAAFADTHFVVEKSTANGRTETSVTPLGRQAARRDEISRMLGGAKITKRTRAHADEILAGARSKRSSHNA